MRRDKVNTRLHGVMAPMCVAALVAAGSCGHRESRLTLSLPDRFEGKRVELIAFDDSVVLAADTLRRGSLTFDNTGLLDRAPLLTQVVIDGRVRGYAVIEEGRAELRDSMSVACGTPLNDRFAGILAGLDSVENLDDMNLYTQYAGRLYNANRDNVLGRYFGVEWLKYSRPESVDSMLPLMAPEFVSSRRVQSAVRAARLRGATAPGRRYADFSAAPSDGARPVSLSSLVRPGRYTIVDFWASWCPYCIKEFPALKELYADFHGRGLDIVGVAVRDRPDDTRAAVAKHELPWTVMYNTQRIPYDVYGFSGIPHHILIGPDGVIISREENVPRLRERLAKLLGDSAPGK